MSPENNLLPQTYLLFRLGGYCLGFEAARLWEVSVLAPVTSVPRVSPYLVGVTQFHGKIVPVLNLAGLLKLPGIPFPKAGGFVVAHQEKPKPFLAGFAVQEVLGFGKFQAADIQPNETYPKGPVPPYGRGWAPPAEDPILLLEMEQLLFNLYQTQTRSAPRLVPVASA
jgi:chemotaxis signal transduction protein